MLKDRELELNDQEEKFLSQKEELNAAVEELMSKNEYLTSTLAELKQRNNELDQILYRASHDLRTPVSSVLGLIGVMRLMGLTAEQEAVVDHMTRKSNQMQSLLSSLADLSTAFFKDITPTTFSLSEIIDHAWRKIDTSANISFEVSSNEAHFFSDKVLLQILFSCLLRNAVTFSRPDVENRIKISCTVSASILTVEFSDTGEEIPAEISEKIFHMFFRGSDRSNGPGLGLYVAQRIAERLSGKIILVSGSGTKRFILTIPELKVVEEVSPIP